MSITVNIGDRWAVIGGTGSGKTWLSRALLSFYAEATQGQVPIYILDTKVQGDFAMFERKGIGRVHASQTPPAPVKDTKGVPFVIWRPVEDDLENYDKFFESIYQLGRNSKKPRQFPAIIYIDELSSICNGLGKAGRYYEILQKQGRGMDIGVISVTQSPSFLPNSTLRQATHAIRMNLNDEYDVKKLSRIMGKAVEEPPSGDFGFWYRDCTKTVRKSPPREYEDFKDFLGL